MMPCIQVLAVVQDYFCVWVRSYQFCRKYRSRCICDSNRMADEGVEVFGCECGIAIEGPKPSSHSASDGKYQVTKQDGHILTSYDIGEPTAESSWAAHR